MNSNVRAWHNDPKLKECTLERLRVHQKLDEFIHGNYVLAHKGSSEGYKGCAIGCTLKIEFDRFGSPMEPVDGWWPEMYRQYGFPLWLSELIDDTFEELEPPYDAQFVYDVADAIPVGANLFHPNFDASITKIRTDFYNVCPDDGTGDLRTHAADLIAALRKAPVST